ncbi:hypothetical protein CJD36_022085 [Flavipsychrobacter stenotrophus]|uniref:Ig-like domain-containing protein n=1 Tax=Flavipsychrobacter stenotrophus TaxID=2077091 RepID=A0A2S7SQD7_9BACT|nr:Ig-like domain-containing protein [Flavipsychrobacter stenotrophus]PQJ08837.1 hypothetical protein CJD36_022085 [Flavipsychrobacter stenotrophus]
MKSFLLSVLCLVVSLSCFADKVFTPNTNASISGTATYCQNATASVLTYTYNTCNTGSGTNVGTDLTITWYSNTINSTVGGSMESVTFVPSSLTATGSTTFLPSTITTGTTYYYCVITWNGTGACNTLGSLTSAVTSVIVNTAPDAIAGTLNGCVGTVTTLTNTVGGGTWTSATVAKATINSSTGAVSAVAAGTSVISYTIGTCRSTATFTVNANPAAITGTNTVCEGAVTTFTDATAGGTWSSSDPLTASVNASSPVGITGVLAGTATISYTLGTGCYAVRGVTVNTAPAAIAGTLSGCAGTITTLTNTVGGGTWTSATVAKATISSSTGAVSAVAAGTSVISYTIGTCRSTATFTVNANPAAITGTNTVCEGAITTFTDATAGGTWSTSDPSTASVNASNPVGITGVLAGTATISYTLGTGCYAVRGVTVNTAPAAISGTLSGCVGTVTTLTNAVVGGTWTSATVAKATINSSTGAVSAVSAGTSLISYTIGSCRSTATFTVNTTPVAITGTNTICENATTTFANTVAGGTWSIVDPSIASLNASSPVTITGLLAGTSTVSYTIGSCAVGRTITVNTAPAAIAGTLSACVGTVTTLTNAVGGGTWTSATVAKATINSSTGAVSAVAAGTSVISYTIGSCRSTTTFTVNANPVAITGTNTICEGAITTFTDATAGGSWSTSDPSTASINASSPVGITGVLAGTATISYTLGTGCYAIRAVTVNTAPTAITGTTNACVGVLTTLSSTPGGGTWTSATVAKATITAGGVVTPVSAGTSLISYTIGSCRSTATFTINTTPAAITGTNTICENATTTFANTVAGGTWSIVDPTVASINASSPVTITGLLAGTSTVSYTIGTCAVGRSITVNTTPTAITGTTNACVGVLTTLSSTPGGGTWTSATAARATISSGGVVTPVSAGTSLISYTIGSCRSTATFTVNTTPAATTGTNTICRFATTNFSNSVAGGTWSTNDAGIATINASSPVTITGVTAGTTIISYTIGTCAVGRSITINEGPAAITGTTSACAGTLTTLSNAVAGGTWTSATPARATITAGGVVSAVSAGTSLISYSIGTCRSTVLFTVNANPSAITGTNTVCEGSVTTFTDATAGGTWSSDNVSIATVDASNPVGITGVNAGSTIITYTLPTSCYATRGVTVNNTPDPISGSSSVCLGFQTTLSDVVGGGTWTTSAPTVATITSGGVVTGLIANTATITYTVGSCNITLPFTVNPNPAAITGTASVCEGSVTTLSNATGGGSWSSNSPSIATVDASDPVGVSGILAGTTTISYTLPTSCYSTRTLTVNPTPVAITGTMYACEGSTTTLSNLTGSGVWSSSASTIATVNASSGAVTGVLAGTANISYTLGTCYTTTGFTTLGTPDAISGVNSICVGATTTFTNSALMGSWSSNDPTIASVDASTGVVTGVLAGTTTITYSNGCGTPAVKSIDIHTVPDMPAAITGTFSFCTGTVSTLADVTALGTWSSVTTGVATITAGGVVTGVSAGTSTISYSFTNECGTSAATQSVTVVDYPTAAITSAENPCMNYASAIVFTGTSGASVVYNIDGAANVTETLTGGTFNLATGNLSATHVYELVEVHNATCTTTYDTFATLIPVPMQWVGGTFAHETEWERASNWSCGFVPGDTTDVTIPSGTTYSPLISTTRIVYTRNLTVASGAVINADVDAFLYVKGALSNGGTLSGDGNLSLNGTSAQAITGIGKVSNFELNNSAGAAINTGARMTIVKSITMTSGTLTTHDSLTLASDASGTARVAPITFGSSIAGNVKVMQYIPGGYRRYRFWSHPFSSTISLSQVQQYLDITGQGGSANGFTTTSTNNPSSYRYNPAMGNSSLSSDPGWRPFTKINALAADTNTFHRYQGIRLFFRGVKGQGLGYITDVIDPNTIGMVGALNQGDQTVALVKGGGANQDYNMVGNPYASPVDIGTVCYNAKTDGKVVGPAFYVWDPFLGAGGQFRTITIGVGAASPYYLQGNSCFQIRAANNGDALTFSESNKGVTSTHNLLKTSPNDVSLVIYDADHSPWDMLSVKFSETATVNEDNDFDAAKLQGGDLNFYSLSADGKKLAIDARPFSEDGVVALGINTKFNKEYIIKSESVVTPGNSPLYLHDKLMNKYVQLEQGTEYRFNVDNNTGTQGEQRFELSMKPGSSKAAATKITLSPNPATDAVTIVYSGASAENVSIRVLDVTGVSVYNSNYGVMQSGNISISLKDLASGIYMVEITSGTNKSVHRLVKE